MNEKDEKEFLKYLEEWGKIHPHEWMDVLKLKQRFLLRKAIEEYNSELED